MPNEKELKEFYDAVETAKLECKDEYALAYLNAIGLADSFYGSEGIKVQILYVLSNMNYWRGDTARRVKKIFKRFANKL